MFRVTAVCTLGMTGLVFRVTAAKFRVLRPSEKFRRASESARPLGRADSRASKHQRLLFRVTAARFRVTAEVYV